MYSWLTEKLRTEFEEVRLLKESPRGSVRLIRHNAGGKQFILRRFQGNGEVYHRLLGCSCRYLPLVYEAAEQDGENIVVEEFVQGDTLDFLLKEALFSPQETKQTVKQLCHGLWVLHSMAAVLHKPEAEADTHILGTTGFAAPEQYGLGQSDTRTDIYSLGVLMNVMLTGQHPSKKLAEGRMGRVIQRCTQVNPAKRYKETLSPLRSPAAGCGLLLPPLRPKRHPAPGAPPAQTPAPAGAAGRPVGPGPWGAGGDGLALYPA